MEKKKMSLAGQIFIALVLAIIVGLLMQNAADFAATYIKPFGTIFLNLVKFIVGPIVLFSIMAGIVSMKDIKKVGAIGGITLVYYFCTTAVAIIIGLIAANLFKGAFPAMRRLRRPAPWMCWSISSRTTSCFRSRRRTCSR